MPDVPLLLLHGNPDSGLVWDAVRHHLSGLTTFAPDLPGFGTRAHQPPPDYQLSTLADQTADLLDTCGIADPLDLVVHDAGAFFGLPFAIQHPQRVRRLVILNTIFHPGYRWHVWARICRVPGVGELAMAGLSRRLLRWEMRRGSPSLDAASIAKTYAHIGPAMKRNVLRMYRALPPEVFAPWHPQLLALTKQIPTTVVWGEDDPYLDRSYGEQFGCPVEFLPGVGHWPQLEAPQRVAAIIREHCSQ